MSETPTPPAPETNDVPTNPAPGGKGPHRRKLAIALLVLLAALGGVRLALPSIVRSYVQRTLDQNPVYDGRIGEVTLHLWRGAYAIEDVSIVKTTGAVPVPFFAAKRVDFSIEWPALAAGEVVGRVVMHSPELNYVDAPSKADAQTGEGGPWMKMIRDLFPFQINSIEVQDGSVHFRAFQTKPPVDVYLSKVEGSIEDLRNVHEDVTPMVSTLRATALAMDQAKLDFEMKLDPFSYRPTFHLALKLLGLDVTKTNALAQAYGRFDFEKGWLDLVMELGAQEGRVTGYVKPIFRDVTVFDLEKDLREGNALNVLWEALVGAASELFKNWRHDQVATVIPISGDLVSPRKDVLAAVGNVLRNAFIRAYLPRFQGTAVAESGIAFGPAALPEELPADPRK